MNNLIQIVSVRCATAQAAGRPYTIRLLPDFLIPRCVIRLDHLQEAAADAHAGERIERVCSLLGCVDTRTARAHLRRFEHALGAATLLIGERLAMSPELGDLPEMRPDTPALEWLERLLAAEQKARLREGGDGRTMGLRQLLQAMLRQRSGNESSSSASPAPRPP